MSDLTKEIILMILTMLAFSVGALVLVDIEFMDSLTNLSSVFAGLSWFVAVFVAATLFTAYLVVVAKIKFIIRFLAIPLWLVFTLSTIFTIDQFLGYAYPVVPPKAQVLSYRMFLEHETGVKMLEAWVGLKTGRTRLYKFEWTEEREEELKKGSQSSAKGIPMEIDLRGDEVKDLPIGKPQGDDMKHDIKHRGLPPKADPGP
jgi:hypothetical protein